MSSHLAIAAVTETLWALLRRAAEVVPGARVTVSHPADIARQGGHGINLFLYEITTEHLVANPLRAPRADPTLVQRPAQRINLAYVLTATGDHVTMKPERLMGRAISILGDHPVLTRDLITHALRSAGNWAKPQDLGDLGRVTLQPHDPSPQELARVWSLFDGPYLLSRVYMVRGVGVGPDTQVRPVRPVDTTLAQPGDDVTTPPSDAT
ncbi:MAG: DUF4255 domain-containing protein [Deltaproteobacteria bacterium]|nr:DUF4255 domain-containing protein [Deltaproteobacteria bacterium]